MNRILSWLRFEETLIFLLAIYLLFLALSLLRYLRPGKQTVRLRRLSFFVLLTALIIFGGKGYFSGPLRAIVLTPQAEARYGPSAQEKLAFTLAEGAKVKVVDRSDGWRRIVFLKEKTGWVKDADLGLI